MASWTGPILTETLLVTKDQYENFYQPSHKHNQNQTLPLCVYFYFKKSAQTISKLTKNVDF